MLKRLRRWGPTVILSDGDIVFQPRKVERSGIFGVVEGHVLIYIHKEEALDDVERRYPADHYVLVDDKPRILAAVKAAWGDRVTTVLPRQGQFALDQKVLAGLPPPDVAIDHIGELLRYELSGLLPGAPAFTITFGGCKMKATQQLHDLGQSLWLDNITRDLLNSGTLKRYIDELSVTGLTSNPTIFDHAIKNSTAYDDRDPPEGEGRANRARSCSSSWRWRTSPGPPICSGRSTTGPTAWTAGCRWKCRRCWPTTPPAPWPRPRNSACPRGPAQPLHQDSRHQRRSARHRGGDLRRRADQRDAACSRASNIWRRPRRTCAASSGASTPGSNPMSARWRRCSSAAGTSRSPERCPASSEQPARHRHRQAHLQGRTAIC